MESKQWTKKELMDYLENEAKHFRTECKASLKRSKHMHNIKPLKIIDGLTQEMIDAILAMFLNNIGTSQGLDLGLYTHYLQEDHDMVADDILSDSSPEPPKMIYLKEDDAEGYIKAKQQEHVDNDKIKIVKKLEEMKEQEKEHVLKCRITEIERRLQCLEKDMNESNAEKTMKNRISGPNVICGDKVFVIRAYEKYNIGTKKPEWWFLYDGHSVNNCLCIISHEIERAKQFLSIKHAQDYIDNNSDVIDCMKKWGPVEIVEIRKPSDGQWTVVE
jgi:hypothetical protein